MERNKLLYDSPVSFVMVLEMQGIICQSEPGGGTDPLNPGGDI